MALTITKKPGEEVLVTLRKNPNKMSSAISKFILMIAASLLLFIFFQNEYVIYGAIIILLIAFSYGFYYFLIWFYDVYIITNLRIICVNQKRLFNKEFVETDLDKVHDVSYSVKGVFGTIFKYGTVTVRTSTGLSLELSDLSDPDEIQEMIKNLAEVSHKKHKKELSANELIELLKSSKK